MTNSRQKKGTVHFLGHEILIFFKRRASLLRLLVATSNTVKDMGYMQGLNSIAGMFLFYLKEEESFWVLLYFMEKMKFKNFLKEDFTTINTLVYQLDLFLEHYLPELTEHFVKNEIENLPIYHSFL